MEYASGVISRNDRNRTARLFGLHGMRRRLSLEANAFVDRAFLRIGRYVNHQHIRLCFWWSTQPCHYSSRGHL